MTPAERYLRDVRNVARKTSAFPFLSKHVCILYNNVEANLKPVPSLPNWVHFDKIYADDPGSGQGQRAMEAICGLADKHQVVLIGRVEAYDDKSIPFKKLLRFYEKYGGVIFDGDMCVRPVATANPDEFKKMSRKDWQKIKNGLTDKDLAKKKKATTATAIILLIIILGIGLSNQKK